MDKVEIKPKLIDMLAMLFPDSGVDKNVLEYTDLMDDLSMDSITFISIVVEIEDVFEITVPDNDAIASNKSYVNDIVAIIDNMIINNELCDINMFNFLSDSITY